MKKETVACLAFFYVALVSAKDLVDQCVGGRWDELLAQSGIVHSRRFPELGLSERLAFECPIFVNQVLFAQSLGEVEKRKVFSEVESWPHEKTQILYLKLKLENQKQQEPFWSKQQSGGVKSTVGNQR